MGGVGRSWKRRRRQGRRRDVPWLDLEKDIAEEFESASGWERHLEAWEGWRHYHLEKKRERDRAYRWRHRRQIKAYRDANKDRRAAIRREWYLANRDRILAELRAQVDKKERELAAKAPPPCLTCGAPSAKWERWGPVPKYCSEKCRIRAWSKTQNRKRREVNAAKHRPLVPCVVCSTPISGMGPNVSDSRKRYCSNKCRNRYWNEKRMR